MTLGGNLNCTLRKIWDRQCLRNFSSLKPAPQRLQQIAEINHHHRQTTRLNGGGHNHKPIKFDPRFLQLIGENLFLIIGTY